MSNKRLSPEQLRFGHTGNANVISCAVSSDGRDRTTCRQIGKAQRAPKTTPLSWRTEVDLESGTAQQSRLRPCARPDSDARSMSRKLRWLRASLDNMFIHRLRPNVKHEVVDVREYTDDSRAEDRSSSDVSSHWEERIHPRLGDQTPASMSTGFGKRVGKTEECEVVSSDGAVGSVGFLLDSGSSGETRAGSSPVSRNPKCEQRQPDGSHRSLTGSKPHTAA